MSGTPRGPIRLWIRVICGVLGLVLLVVGGSVALRSGRSALGAIPALVFGLLLLIPAFGARSPRPGTGLAKIASRFHRARAAAWLGTVGGLLGLAVLRALDRSYPPGQVAGTTLGAPLRVLFSVLFFGGLVSSLFATYYVDLGEKMASEEENDADSP